MKATSNPTDIRRLFESGVSAALDATSQLQPDEWMLPACGDWDRADTMRHMCAVADWYHSWLDRALDGDSSVPFAAEEFDERNRIGVADRQATSGPDAAAAFEHAASTYLERAVPNWDVPFGFPLGTVTVGTHLGFAAAEWHLHAWDLTRIRPVPHQPADAEELFLATGRGVAAATGGLRGRLLGLVVPLAAKRAPWDTMLTRSGRSTRPSQ